MNSLKKYFLIFFISISVMLPTNYARADIWGADVAVLMQILAETIEQVIRLQTIIENGKDTLNLLRDINSGVKSGLYS